MTAATPETFTETQKSRLFFNLWHQILEVMQTALKSRMACNEGVYFIEIETKMSQPPGPGDQT